MKNLQFDCKFDSRIFLRLSFTIAGEELKQRKEAEEKLRTQVQEGTQRESVLVIRLTSKEQEVQELLVSVCRHCADLLSSD